MRYTVRASKRLCVCVRVEAVGQLYTEEEERSSSYASYVYLEVSIYECIVMSLTTLDAATVPAGLLPAIIQSQTCAPDTTHALKLINVVEFTDKVYLCV